MINLASEYYENGSVISEFRGKSLDKVNKILFDLLKNKNIKKGFYFKTKYKNSSDLFPNVIDYDECFLDLLIESNIHNLIFKCLGPDYAPSYINIRKVDSGKTYLNWHRDTYNYGNKVGDFPPAHKIIYYPFLEGVSNNPKLIISRSSHLKMHSNKFTDFIHNLLPIKQNKIDKYLPSNKQFIFFNGSTLHKVCDDTKPSICIIYSFIRQQLIKEDTDNFY